MKEVLTYYWPQIEGSDILDRLRLEAGHYFVVSAHREENIDNAANFSDLMASLKAIAEKYDLPLIVTTHPRTRHRMESLNMGTLDHRIRFLKPLGFLDYVKLQLHARCVLSDSGTITEEASILSFPAVTIRQAHERPEGMDEGTLIMCGLKTERVIESVDIVVKQDSKDKRQFHLVQDYDTDNVSKKVLRIIVSYTDYINRTVWRIST